MTGLTGVRPHWVDFHCHLDLYPDHAKVIAECDREAVATLAVTTTPKAFHRNRELAATSAYVRVALGLHPQLVADREAELPLFERQLHETRYVGEIGLDAGPRFYRSFEIQERVLERILRACAEQGDKVLTLHSVRAVGKVLSQLERHVPPGRARPVLHWFTGTAVEAKRAVGLGCYFSINAEMLKTPKHRALVASLPADRLLTETDGPFVEKDGRPVRPPDVKGTVASLAEVRGVLPDAMARQIISNLGTLLGI